MHFLNPEAFWAFFLVAIPILIHLFNLRRIKKIYFSNLSFLRDVTQQQKSRSTLKKLLILTCRVLALVFLIFAFSRPVWEENTKADLSESQIIYLDNSLSLQRTDDAGNLLLINALNAVEGALVATPKGSEVGLFTNDRSYVNRLVPVTKVLEELQEVDYSQNTVPFDVIYQRTERVAARELLVFTDLQRSSILPLGRALEDTSRHITFYGFTSPVVRNLYVDTVFLQKPLGIRTQNEITIGIENTGGEEAKDVLVKVFKDNQQLSSFTIDVSARSFTNVSLEVGVNSPVDGNYRVEIDDAPIVFDNVYYFTINPVDRPLVVILSDGAASDYLASVYSNEEFFQLITTTISNTSFQDIARADLLVLDQLNDVPDWLISQMDNIEGNILVVPGPNADLSSYTQVLKFPIERIESPRPDFLSTESLEGPFLQGVFNKKNERMSMPQAKVKYSASGYFQPLITTATDMPFLVKAGTGDTFFFTVPFSDSVTNFPKHALFVPVMYKLAQTNEASDLAYQLDVPTITVQVDSLSPQAIVKLSNESATVIPTYRYVDSRLIMELPEVLNTPGIYHLISESDTLKSIALNYNEAESKIESLSIEELTRMVSGYDHITIEEIADVNEFIEKKNNAVEQDGLWKYALILALFFILSELLILRYI